MATASVSGHRISGKRSELPGMRLQPRDGEMFWAVYTSDGILGKRHLKDLFWRHASERAMLKRLAHLVAHKYLTRPTKRQWRYERIPESVYWLGWKGIVWIAEQQGVFVQPPKNTGENQMRKLQRTLKEEGIRWLREPGWSILAHNLLVTDFRLALERSVNELPSITLEEWAPESEFRADMDQIEFEIEGTDGALKKEKRRVCPDGLFVIADEKRKARGEPHRLPLLLELDMGTHSVVSRFGRQKAAPYAAYVKSAAYKKRLGFDTGTWLIVTRGKRRMDNLMKQTERATAEDSRLFFFTVFDEVENANLLTAPVWRQVDMDEPVSLLSG